MDQSANLTTGPIARLRHVCAELGYAQRRLFELRTGIPARTRPPRRRTPSAGELEAWFALEGRGNLSEPRAR